MAAVTKAFLEQAYLAYFGRPVDPNGALFWLQPGTTQADVVNGFSNSAESISLYGAPTVNPGLVFTQVNAIYNVLFGRDGDVAGVTWWANQIITGKVVAAAAAVEILNGAQGSDKTIVDNKLAASAAFTAGLDTIDEINGYSGDAATAVAREWLATVTTTPASPAEVDAAIADSVAASAPPPALTLAVDSPSVVEGDSGLQQLVFTLTLSAAQTTDTVVNFQTLNTGTATAGSDFNPAAGAVTFVAGQTSATVTVMVKGDTVYEPNETVKVQFSSVALAAPVTATGTIINDDILPQTFVLTTGQDILTGGDGADQFMATQATLQLGDVLNGGAGQDTLNLSVSGHNGVNTGFAATSIETIKVKSLAAHGSTLNMSDVSGVTEIQSNESSGGWTFDDIQSVNSTAISITDTSATHNFNYDTNAYTAGIDTVKLALSEIDGAEINFDDGSSDVENIEIVSGKNPIPPAGDTAATVNTVSDLNVGDKLATVKISGDAAKTTVVAALDKNVELVNAADLLGDLKLDLSNSNDGNPADTGKPGNDDGTTVEEIVYIGAHGDDYVEFGSTDNAKDVTLGEGDDWVRTGTGISSVNGGSGDDTIITGALNDNVIGGLGNDDVTDAGANNAVLPDWDARFASGGNIFDLGDGNDGLTVTGGGNNTADLGTGNDTMMVGAGEDIVSGNQVVTAGDGNDSVSLYANGWANVDLGAGDDDLLIVRDKQVIANSTVTAGAGDDTVTVYSNGNVSGTGGDGNDNFTITGNGGHTLDMGAGSDTLIINGDGTHNLTLGSGDDYLAINGARNTAGNADNGATDGNTVINAGDGNDTVYVSADHYLDADLGAGNDALHMRAKDLTVDDTIAAGAGNDTLWLSNESGKTEDGRILASETIHTTGFETYELLDSNVTLKLTDRMITTAEGMDFTVSTVNSKHTDLPELTSNNADVASDPLTQGMSYGDFVDVVYNWMAGDYNQAPGAWYYDALPASERFTAAQNDLVTYIQNTVGIDWTDTNSSGPIDTNSSDAPLVIDNYDPLVNGSIQYTDQVFFRLDKSGAQTVNMTGITTPEYKFTLNGGNIRDIVIGNDATINSMSTLDFNNSVSTALSYDDTLVVIGGAEITAADMRNVTGLERIELKGGGNGIPQIWGIELTDRVIDQTTGSAALVIHVDSNVEPGSKLYITLDPSIVNASNDVVIQKNASVTVYINGNKVTEPQLGQDFNPGTYKITVVNELIFTATGDNLVGTGGDDTFIANQLSHIQAGDSANGNNDDGFDTLQLNFAVSNGANTLQEMFNDASLTDIQRIEFNTENNVTFGGIGFGYASSLQELATNEGNDTLTLMRQGLLYELNAGDDSIGLLSLGAGRETTTVDGGAGLDTVTGSSGDDNIVIRDVESVQGGLGEDEVWINQPGSDAVDHLITFSNVESIYGSYGEDNILADRTDADETNIYVHSGNGNDKITVGHVGTGPNPNYIQTALVYGGQDADSITVNVTASAVVYGDNNDWGSNPDCQDTINVTAPQATVYGSGGDDSITVYASTQSSVDGGYGNDTINIGWTQSDPTNTVNVTGGYGNDSITVETPETASVSGGDGNDTISVNNVGGLGAVGNATIDGGNGNDSINTNYGYNLTVYGGDGNDTINAIDTWTTATVDGGTGNDSITVSAHFASTTITVTGGTGNDTITVGFDDGQGGLGATTITGGDGDDHINLWLDANSGLDQLVFGNVTYDALQDPLLNTQGRDTITNFNFEVSGAGAEDVLNFQAFMGAAPVIQYADWTGGVTNTGVAAATNLYVVAAQNNFVLTGADVSVAGNGVHMLDNGKGVVVVAKDGGGLVGFDHFDVYYVQDVDSDTGQVWAVDLVGQITSATEVGALTSLNAANFM